MAIIQPGVLHLLPIPSLAISSSQLTWTGSERTPGTLVRSTEPSYNTGTRPFSTRDGHLERCGGNPHVC